jgi:hypothetical protein
VPADRSALGAPQCRRQDRGADAQQDRPQVKAAPHCERSLRTGSNAHSSVGRARLRFRMPRKAGISERGSRCLGQHESKTRGAAIGLTWRVRTSGVHCYP